MCYPIIISNKELYEKAQQSTIREELGRGENGIVELIEVDDRLVCLKRAKDGVTPLFHEQNILIGLNGAGGAPLVLYQCKDYPAYVMTFTRGVDMVEFVQHCTPDEFVRCLIALFKSLDEIHRSGYIHGDIKPDNMFVEENENGDIEVHVIDFGLSLKIGTPQFKHAALN
ncbi:probable serine/threonine-protein kinase YabT [Homarus americanus]|uniref:probable serine/threonine-protein kinase YabT n=1 Tax=Homarus americanus TaxID=6706 RepID=UPI001C437823|nr:probable serine/threonine-protein kinase YabT [Homarus americanus]